MSRLSARIIRLEHNVPTGLRALTDEELEARLAELLAKAAGVTVEEVRAWSPEDRRRFLDEIRAELRNGSTDEC